jgi:hypothetical protein
MFLLKEISENIIGMCNHPRFLKQGHKMGLELRLAIRGDFDKLDGCGRLHVNNRRLLCTFCNCDTTFAFSPTAILDHFDMNREECLKVLLLRRDENRIFDAELADLRLHKSKHDASNGKSASYLDNCVTR